MSSQMPTPTLTPLTTNTGHSRPALKYRSSSNTPYVGRYILWTMPASLPSWATAALLYSSPPSRHGTPTTTVSPAVASTTCSRHFAASWMNCRLKSRSSGGYPVTASSGSARRSASWAFARSMNSRMRCVLPRRSPTVAFIWARARRNVRMVYPGQRCRSSLLAFPATRHRVYHARGAAPGSAEGQALCGGSKGGHPLEGLCVPPFSLSGEGGLGGGGGG